MTQMEMQLAIDMCRGWLNRNPGLNELPGFLISELKAAGLNPLVIEAKLLQERKNHD